MDQTTTLRTDTFGLTRLQHYTTTTVAVLLFLDPILCFSISSDTQIHFYNKKFTNITLNFTAELSEVFQLTNSVYSEVQRPGVSYLYLLSIFCFKESTRSII